MTALRQAEQIALKAQETRQDGLWGLWPPAAVWLGFVLGCGLLRAILERSEAKS